MTHKAKPTPRKNLVQPIMRKIDQRTEVTGKKVRTIAGRFLRMGIAEDASETFYDDRFKQWRRIDWCDIRALAASALTQAPNRPRSRKKG